MDSFLMGFLAGARRVVREATAFVRSPVPASSPRPEADAAAEAAGSVRSAYWEDHFATEDPWGYGDAYEQTKYDRTAALLDGLSIGRALELACAEGHFTVKLADRVHRLRATDIASKAVQRAKERLKGKRHVEFGVLDFVSGQLGRDWDLIVCSEALYYCEDLEMLQGVVDRIVGALAPNGFFLTAHAHLLHDDPTRTCFDWASRFGIDTIGRAVARDPNMVLRRSIEAELYRIELFQKAGGNELPAFAGETVAVGPLPSLRARQSLVRDGCAIATRNQIADLESTGSVPVLMYHRIADEGPAGLGDWRVSPANFEEQIRFLSRRGYRSLPIEEWDIHAESGEWITGRPIILSFDDGYSDFLDCAWPILCDYGFSAHVFIVAGHVGGAAQWDSDYGPPAPLMGWKDLRRLSEAGCGFGSHLVSHTRVDRLSGPELAAEAATSRAVLERELAKPIRSVCLPHDYTDDAVQDAMQSAGYTSIFGVRSGIASIHNSRRDIVRVPVYGSTGLEEFAGKLEKPGLEGPQAQDRGVLRSLGGRRSRPGAA